MKKFQFAVFFAVIATTFALTSCYKYDQGVMTGGSEMGTSSGPGDSVQDMPASKADGAGRPVANGAKDIDPRQIYTKADTNATSRAY